MEEIEYVGRSNYAHWEETRKKLREKNSIGIDYGVTATPGVKTVEATHFEFNAPIGTLYYRTQHGKTLSIEHIVVLENFRKCGVGRELLNGLIKYAKLAGYKIVTARVTEFSHGIIDAAGFVWNEAQDAWVLDPEEETT